LVDEFLEVASPNSHIISPRKITASINGKLTWVYQVTL
jgi:hypothetical protein